MPGRDGHHLVPQHLSIVVSVVVDKAGANNFTRGVDGFFGRTRRVTNGDNFTIDNTEITFVAWRIGAVDNGAATDF